MTVTHLHGSVHGSTTVETWADPFAGVGTEESAATDNTEVLAGGTAATDARDHTPNTASREYEVREWLSDWVQVPAFTQVIPSWTAATPQGTWIEVAARVRSRVSSGGESSSDWGIAARWSSGIDYVPARGTPDWHSHSVYDQKLTGLKVDADTLEVRTDDLGGSATEVQARVRLFRPAPSAFQLSAAADPIADPWPEVTRVSVLTRTSTADTVSGGAATDRGNEKGDHREEAAGTSAVGPTSLLLPQFSQRIHGSLPGMGAGDSWCSPTSAAMVEAFWAAGGQPEKFPAYPPAEPAAEVPATVARVWDYAYGGAGNWAFNVSWLASLGFDAYLDSLSGLDELAEVLRAGEPVVASVRFSKADLPEAGYETGGHLLVVSGIDAAGDVRVHDPAARTNDDVRRTYPRAAFERAWLGGSSGLVYRVRPRNDRTGAGPIG